jgi:hypothetical protein
MPLCSTSIRSELSKEHFFRFVSLIHGFAVENLMWVADTVKRQPVK